MELDDAPSIPSDPLTQLVRQDLDPLSVTELDARIAALEGEIARSRRHRQRAIDHRSHADALFRQ